MTSKQLAQAVEAADLVRAFKSYGVTQVDVAHVAQVDPKTVYEWKTVGARPRTKAYDRLDGLREVVRILADSLTERGVGQWLHARNRILNGRRPLDLLHEDGQSEVLQAAHAFVDGSYI